MLLPFRAVAAFCLFASATSTAANSNKDRTVRNVAIIGAGAAGSSAAYHLQKFATEEQVAINVTIFEKSDRIGGRTLTVNAYDHPSMPVELGASIFVGVNHILTGAVEEFKLPLANISDQKPGDITAIWDGQNVVFQSENGASWWYDAVRMWWRYGTSPYRAVSLMKNVVNIFLKIYEPPYFPFRSLTQRVYELGLERATGVTGQQFLADNKINPNFCRDIIQAATRVNYASNLPHIHGLEAMVSFATDGAVSVAGGNWQIFDRMVAASGATILKSTAVDSITLEKRRPASGRYKYHLKAGNNSEPLGAFDDVIIATPWQFSDISAGAGVIKHSMEKIPYTKLHVTLFTSPFELQSGFFGLAPGSKAPHNVYTTLGANEMSHPGAEGVGRAGFYSVSTLRTVTNPNTQRTEYLYKIFSAEAVTPAFLEKLLGAEVPAEFVAADADVNHVPTISWYYPHWFNSYPIELPRVTFQDIMVNDGIYYTSGIESFISTMETSALMGKNVARLVVNDIAGLPQQEHVRGSERFPTRGRAGSRRPTVREDFFDSLESELEGLMLGPDEL